MIKIRLMGEREEIKIIIENISHINDVRILSLSDFYANRGGASDYGRASEHQRDSWKAGRV